MLAATGYLTSVLKDLCCIPRPYSPPVTRLSVGNHALEASCHSPWSARRASQLTLPIPSLLKRAHSLLPLSPYLSPIFAISQYGFPSTHSANSISMALYFAELVYRHHSSLSALSAAAYAFLGVMAFSVVFGRLYCGMHSLTDVAVGSAMGVLIWAAHWVAEGAIERLTLGASWLGTPRRRRP